MKNKTNNTSKNSGKNNMNNIKIKTKAKNRTRIVVGLVATALVATALGTAIYFAGVMLPAGCEEQADKSFKCDHKEDFANINNIDETKSDAWMQVKDNHIVLNPAEEIKLHKGNSFADSNVAAPKQICGTLCGPDSCDSTMSDPSKITIETFHIAKNEGPIGFESLNFLDSNALAGQYALKINTSDNIGLFMLNSSNPEVAIVNNHFGGARDAPIRPLSPGKMQIGINLCGEQKKVVDLNVTDEGFADINEFDRKLNSNYAFNSLQGLALSKNVSKLDEKYNIQSAELKTSIADLAGLLVENSPSSRIQGMLLIMLSNDNGNTWYWPTKYYDGNSWFDLNANNINFAYITAIKDLDKRIWHYDFANSSGHELKWAVSMQSQNNTANVQVLNQQSELKENTNSVLAQKSGNGGADAIDFEAGEGVDDSAVVGRIDNLGIEMTASKLIESNKKPNTNENPFIYDKDLISGGIVSNHQPEKYYFLTNSANDFLLNDNVSIESSDPSILEVRQKIQDGLKVKRPGSQDIKSEEMTSAVMAGLKPGYAQIKVDYTKPANENSNKKMEYVSSFDEILDINSFQINRVKKIAYIASENKILGLNIANPLHIIKTLFEIDNNSINNINKISLSEDGSTIIAAFSNGDLQKIENDNIAGVYNPLGSVDIEDVMIDNDQIFALGKDINDSAYYFYTAQNLPNNIQLGNKLPIEKEGKGMFVLGNYVYIANTMAGLRIVDVSDINSPFEASLFCDSDDNECNYSSVYVVDNYAYVTAGQNFKILDVADKTQIKIISNTFLGGNSSVFNVYIDGNYAYVAGNNHFIISIADKNSPKIVGQSNTAPDAASAISTYDPNYFFIANHATSSLGGGLQILEISDEKQTISREFGFLVLPKPYLNLDQMDISYTATKQGEDEEIPDKDVNNLGDEYRSDTVEDTEPLPNHNFSTTPVKIYRGDSRVILKFNPDNDETKNELNNALKNDKIEVRYGTDKNNLDNTAKVYFDDKDNKYYAVLKKLKGGKKDNYNQDGFENGRMTYYYRLKANDQNIFAYPEKKTTLIKFSTLNRERTILYFYNWLFNKEYNLEQDYDWKKVQDGGLAFWDNTNMNLSGIKFVMLNDQKYEAFNKLMAKKKIDKNLVLWMYKTIHDRIYEEDLYSFGDEKGVQFWLNQMIEIASKDRISKEGVKFAISISPEYRKILSEISASEQEASAEFAYLVVLKRGGDKDGVNYLADNFKTPKEMRENLLNSFEYNNRLEAIEKKFGRKPAITELYETIYARAADVKGVEYWNKSGKSIQDIKKEFLTNLEFGRAASI